MSPEEKIPHIIQPSCYSSTSQNRCAQWVRKSLLFGTSFQPRLIFLTNSNIASENIFCLSNFLPYFLCMLASWHPNKLSSWILQPICFHSTWPPNIPFLLEFAISLAPAPLPHSTQSPRTGSANPPGNPSHPYGVW